MNVITETPWIATGGKNPHLPAMTFVFVRYPGEMREQVEAANGGYGEAAGGVNWPEVAEYRLKHPSDFDPAAWLDAYAAEGGSYAVTPDGALWLGIIGFVGEDLAKHTAPLRGRPDREEAIKALIRERSLIA